MLPTLATSLTGLARPRPEPGTPIDNLNPLTAGLLLATAYNEGGGSIYRDDAVSGRQGTIPTTGHVLREDGLYIPTGTTSGSCLLPVATNARTVTSATIAWAGTFESAGGNGRVIIHRNPTTFWGLTYNQTSTTIVPTWNGTAVGSWSGTLSIALNVPAVIVWTVTATSSVMYFWDEGNGLRIFTRTQAFASQAWDTNFITGGDPSATTLIARGLYRMAAIWSRSLSAPEVSLLIDDLYQLWQPSPMDLALPLRAPVVVGGIRHLIGSSLIGENPLLPVWM